jgi:hypothetical protein
VAPRRALRAYLHGLLPPRERTKTLTGRAGTEPVVGAQAPPAQRLPWFLSASTWDAEALNGRRLEVLCRDPATQPHLYRSAGENRSAGETRIGEGVS